MDQIALAMASTTTTAAMTAMTSASSRATGMDMGGSCKISMLWNWNTIDACFIASSWRITSHGMFAGSCIGVILLVMCLEFLRRLSKEYDRYILECFKRDISKEDGSSYKRTQVRTIATTTTTRTMTNGNNTCDSNTDDSINNGYQQQQHKHDAAIANTVAASVPVPAIIPPSNVRFRPTLVQQSIRALLHMVTFAVAYFVMLLAMYYNGYFIICIFIGAYLGAFAFTWESINISTGVVSVICH
ncbi:hypothetical protein UA08_07096 [Talaromyces atroroseus]|uniref:Copper transport protein n=1 Tax=Talaromyces atroroseus TaxID=1441469 RepID=A0A225AH99_TALAT|nr:hypothetical protein UA08_07096 [Talaromyces atroroseus]OKL57534.1 hypothetical protein UA08_07096 [Talaromyces atroroseus]